MVSKKTGVVMILNEINFPYPIVDAIHNRKLVVFAGAGVSMDSPTKLPNFRQLAERVAEGTEFTLRRSDECEVFLGILQAREIPVNDLVAQICAGTCLKHNKTHEAILDLFQDCSDVKIVTTNYDKMFESASQSKGFDVASYCSPALPLGNDVRGIIHIHGIVDSPKYMVVTDEDFGKAYLTDGYVSRFLVSLFESYTILFVGYSYNDTIMRYLTRAMSRKHAGERYILTDERKKDWYTLGINPIYYKKGSHPKMREGIVQLGKMIKIGLVDWKNCLAEIKDAPPRDQSMDTEIDFCLADSTLTKVLANSVRGIEWLNYLDEKKVFDGCFSHDYQNNDNCIIWSKWLCNNIVGKSDECFWRFVIKHGGTINETLAKYLLCKLRGHEDFEKGYYAKYVNLVEKYLTDTFQISIIIENTFEKELYQLTFRLFKKMFAFELKPRRSYWIEKEIEYKSDFFGASYQVRHLWEIIGGRLIELYAYPILSFAIDTIENLHNQFEMLDCASKNHEPYEMSLKSIEGNAKYIDDSDLLPLLNCIYQDSATHLQNTNPDLLRAILKYCVQAESIYLRRTALLALRNTGTFNEGEKLSVLIQNGLIDYSYEHEQVFRLVESIYPNLSESDRKALINEIKKIDQKSSENNNHYKVFNWCIWLLRNDEENETLCTIVDDYHKLYGFAERKKPELTIEESEAVWIQDQSPKTEEDLLSMPINEAIYYIREYKGENEYLDGPSRYGLLVTFSRAASKKYYWTSNFASGLIEKKIKNEEIWIHLIRGIEASSFTVKELVSLLDLIATNIHNKEIVENVADLFLTVIKKKETRHQFAELKGDLLRISDLLWNNRSKKNSKSDQVRDDLFGTIGCISQAWIIMVSYLEENEISEVYKTKFEQLLTLKASEKRITTCVIAGNINRLIYRDKNWCKLNVLPLFVSGDKNVFSSAWEGIAFFSSSIYLDTMDVFLPICVNAAKHVEWIQGDAKIRFLDRIVIMTQYADGRNIKMLIPNLYTGATLQTKCEFIDAISSRLRNMSENEKSRWWNEWLKGFLKNRKCNKPSQLEEDESKRMLCMLPQLEFAFDEAVQIICSEPLPTEVDRLFWFSLNDSHIARRYSHGMYNLLVSVLSHSNLSSWDNDYVKSIADELGDLAEDEQKSLKEVMLLKNVK